MNRRQKVASEGENEPKCPLGRTTNQNHALQGRRALFSSSLYYPNVGGVENSIRAMARVLSSRGVDVDIVCSDLDQSSERRLPSRESMGYATIHRYRRARGPFAFALDIAYACGTARKLARDGEPYSLIIARSQRSVLALRLAGIQEITYVVPAISANQDAHRASVGSLKGRVAWFVNAFLQRVALNVSDRVVVLSDNMKRQVAEFMGPDALIESATPGVDRERFKPVGENEKVEIRARLSLPQRQTILLGLGRFSPVKGFDQAVNALARLPDHFVLLLVGEGPCLEQYKTEARRLNIEERVLVRPRTETPELYFQAADVFVFTSTNEAFGQVLLEATGCGLPIVALRSSPEVTTATDEIYDGFGALVAWADLNNPDSLADALRRAAGPGFSSEEFHAQRERFARRYSWAELVDQLSSGPTRRVRQ